jgi:ABC-type molybdenum transport system ATPase subunit/photorepair protein PhrA/GNAT superfamily N-acetyltransferase
MPRVDLDLEVNIERTPRVAQLEGMFDVPEAKRQTASFHFEAPFDQQPWQIGLIVGPSGAGKSSVARHLFGDAIVSGYDWHHSKSLVDSFPSELSIRDVTAALSSIGFSSPPSWLKPFHVLSNGEQFRATLARAICDTRQLVVVDEFTSVIDRTVAEIGSAAIAKAIRRAPGKQLVAVTCHFDVADWLTPDWILEPHVGRFTWREKRRRPAIDLEIRRVHHSLWKLFAPHHYLTAEINHAATCFGAFYRGRAVAFDAWLPFVGALKDSRKARRGHRTVCLPDFQGVGIGRALFDTIASAWAGLGYRAFSRTAHPAEIASRQRGGNWQLTRHGFTAKDTGRQNSLAKSRTTDRRAASFEWCGPPMPAEEARRLVA